MNEININPRTVRTVADDLTRYINDLDALSKTFDTIEKSVSAAWVGASVQDYLECIRQTRNKISQMTESLRTTRKALNNTAQSVEDAEKKLKDIMTSGYGGNGRGGGGGGGGFR